MAYTTKIVKFQSAGDFRRDIEKNRPAIERHARSFQKNWCGDESFDDSMRYLQYGNTKMVSECQNFLDQLMTQIPLSRNDWQNDIAGAFPDVPAYLSGMPECMRRRVHQNTNTTPIRIIPCVSVSAMITTAQLVKRGVVICALALQLQKLRQVEVWTLEIDHQSNGSGDYATMVKLAMPLQLSEVCYMLTSAGYARRLCLAHSMANGAAAGWPREKDLSKLIGADPKNDLVLKPLNMYEEETKLMLGKPTEWINAQIKHFTEARDE